MTANSFIHFADEFVRIALDIVHEAQTDAQLELLIVDLRNILGDGSEILKRQLSLEEYADVVTICYDAVAIIEVLDNLLTYTRTD